MPTTREEIERMKKEGAAKVKEGQKLITDGANLKDQEMRDKGWVILKEGNKLEATAKEKEKELPATEKVVADVQKEVKVPERTTSYSKEDGKAMEAKENLGKEFNEAAKGKAQKSLVEEFNRAAGGGGGGPTYEREPPTFKPPGT